MKFVGQDRQTDSHGQIAEEICRFFLAGTNQAMAFLLGEGSAGIHAIIEQNELGETFVSSLLKGGQLARKVCALFLLRLSFEKWPGASFWHRSRGLCSILVDPQAGAFWCFSLARKPDF
jgi:hypothetical protein